MNEYLPHCLFDRNTLTPYYWVKEYNKGHQHMMQLLLILQSFWKFEKKKKKQNAKKPTPFGVKK